MNIAARRFPRLFAAMQQAAPTIGERLTSDKFADLIHGHDARTLHVCENKLSVMTKEQVKALIVQLLS